MLQKINAIKNNQYFYNYVIYCVGLVLYGILMIALGPLIPYLSERQNKVETEYSVYFLARALGFVTGALSIKITQKYFSYHTLLGVGYIVSGVFSIAANQIQYRQFCVVYFFIASAGFCYIDLFSNIATINSFRGKNLDKWLQFLHGCFGIGGLLGPYIIYLLEFKAFTIIGTITICLSIFIFKKKSPQQEIKKQQRYSLMDNDALSEIPEKKNNMFYISLTCTALMSISFLLLVGQQASYGSWIPSYAVMRNFSSKEHATSYSSIYWFSITFFRFAFLFAPGKIKQKIYALVIVGVFCSIFSVVLIYFVNPELGLVFGSIIFGMSNSALFPLLLSLPGQYGLSIQPNQNSYFMLSAALGQGTVSVATGYLMKLFGPELLFITMALMNLIGLINHIKICQILSNQRVNSEVQLREMSHSSNYK